MPVLIGFLLVLLAALLQGTFVLPMTLVRQWSWEHTWATFSFLGMIVFNWIITFLFIPGIFSIYAASPGRDLAILAIFGLGWGVGAVLFGLGMDRLGMALGYPIIMGLIASLGALIPLLVFFPQTLFAAKGLVLLAGTALVIFGIVLCSVGGSRHVALRRELHCGAIQRIQDRAGDRDHGWHAVVPSQCRNGFRKKRNQFRRDTRRLTCLFRKYGLGAVIHLWLRRERRLLLVSDDHQKHPEPVLESGDAAQPRSERLDGLDVDWKLLSLRSRRGKARTLGCSGGLATVYLVLHRHREPLGFMAR